LLPLCIAADSVLLRIIGSRHRVRRLALICAILLCLACAALIGMTRTVDGRVLRKSEQIQLARTGLLPAVLHIYRMVVRPGATETPDASASEEVTLAVDSPSFDRLREGDTVTMRELRLGPLRFARLSDVPWWHVLPWPEAQRFWPWSNTVDPLSGTVHVASATVTEVRTVREAVLQSWTQRGSTWELPLNRPYQEVTLRLQTEGASTALALDRVDLDSVPNLVLGRVLIVNAPDSRWREAHLAAGTRRYAAQAWELLAGVLLPQILAGVAVALLVAYGLFRLIRRASRRAARRARA
jgi:hypothetical protein